MNQLNPEDQRVIGVSLLIALAFQLGRRSGRKAQHTDLLRILRATRINLSIKEQ